MGRAKVKESISRIRPYVPGTSSYDLGRPVTKLSSNENPYGPSPKAVAAICSGAPKVNLYPDKEARALRNKLSSRLGIPADCICIGNGSDDLLENLGKLYLGEGDNLISHSGFSTYETVALSFGAERRLVENPPEKAIDTGAMMDACDQRTKMLVVCTPNNPTGAILTEDQIVELLTFTSDRGIFLVLDEAYSDFSERYVSPAPGIVSGDLDAAVTRTFSKAYGLAGLRVGYCIAPARVVRCLNTVRMPFNASSIAQAAAIAALDDDDFYAGCVGRIREGRRFLSEALASLGLKVYPSEANFVLASVPEFWGRAKGFAEALQGKGFAIRDCTTFGLPDHVRITVGTEEQNSELVRAIQDILN